MQTAEIRRRWLGFFEQRGHTVVPSAPLLYDDPNLLFVNAGMVPFKPYLLGQESPPYPRAASVQKCLRTGDIDEVGKTSRHGTFFQMQGNFSFGDYFKEGAIGYAWELLTTPVAGGGYGLDPDVLWVTVLDGDDESARLWTRLTDIPAERIVRRGPADNFWSMGVPGPGGPCSEIYVDRGPDYGPEGGPAVDEDRFMEIWNLVFMESELSAVRSKTDFDIAGSLPHQNIDTGMGLERLASILQGVDNMYEIDEVAPVLARAADLAGKTYGRVPSHTAAESHPDDVRLRVVADHVRSSVMLIGDGVTPGNEGRGYVLRRMLRRAVRSMRLLGVHERALPELVPVGIACMAASYPDLARDQERIEQIAYAEEESFRRTLASGTSILDVAVSKTKAAGHDTLGGDDAFQLHDTYGFPIDLTLEMAAEQGIGVDLEAFRRLMQEQRDRAKADAKAKKSGHADTAAYRMVADGLGREVDFTGYHEITGSGRVVGLIGPGGPASRAAAGDEIEIVLDSTPFYAESGGQLADHGRIRLEGGAVLDVHDVQKPIAGLIVHRVTVTDGVVEVGDTAHAQVDADRRRSISGAHTATHLVHQALRDALGSTATQAGSENSPGRLRFDFTYNAPLSPDALAEIEERVNTMLALDLPVGAQVMNRQDAVASGAMALFGEKYGENVRVVSIGDWSKELCGGTHLSGSGQVGLVKLLGESSIGAGTRRIEALVGTDAFRFLSQGHAILARLGEQIKARPEELPQRVEALLARLKDAERQIAAHQQQAALSAVDALVEGRRDIDGTSFVAYDAAGGLSADDLRLVVLDVRSRLGEERPAVVAGATVAKDRPVVVVATNAAARSRGVAAGALVKIAATCLGGGGGGKDDVAQGGGTDVGAIPRALDDIAAALGRRRD